MNDIGVTSEGHTQGASTGSGDERVALADSDQVAHERIVATVRWLLAHTNASQRTLADLLECDVSSVNRSLIIKESGPRTRRREWRAHEVFRLALFFDLPVQVFYGTNIEEVWADRMAAARADHQVLLQSLDEGDD